MNYLFDVDGTLTEPRQKITKEFKKFFADWTTDKIKNGDAVILVTGSDSQKTKEQLGSALWRHVTASYQNCGNQMYARGRLLKESKWRMSALLHLDILTLIETSPYYGKAENNIEERVGMINISTVGRSADNKLRKAYFTWDQTVGERKKIVEILGMRYPRLEFSIGGEISIDIYPKGKDKSQVLEDWTDSKTVFFGDSCHEGGNDYSIAQKSDRFHQVSDPKETEYVLKSYYTP